MTAPRYTVLIRPSAERDAGSLPKADLERMARRIQRLADDPRPPGCKKLGEPAIYRVRQGDYRVLYQIDDDNRTVVILKVAHRRDVYR